MAITLASATFTIATVSIVAAVWNIIKQLYFKDPNQPPVVFHWLPLVGSTVSYGQDPYQFFFDCQNKVSLRSHQLCGYTDFCSMGIVSLSFY